MAALLDEMAGEEGDRTETSLRKGARPADGDHAQGDQMETGLEAAPSPGDGPGDSPAPFNPAGPFLGSWQIPN